MFKALLLTIVLLTSHIGGDHVYKYLETRIQKPDKEVVDNLVATQNPDGSWSDIDYHDTLRGAWKTNEHPSRLVTLSTAWHYDPRPEVLAAARKGLDYWFKTRPICPNWWYNEIAVPYEFGLTGIWLRDELTEDEIKNTVDVMNQLKYWRTGQNKIWAARNWLLRGLLEDDKDFVRQCRDSIASEICVTTKEGIQPDWSYHQHGPQLQFGNYGGSYASEMSEFYLAFKDTPLAFSKEQEEILKSYVREGLRWVVWKGVFDMSACGRQITPGAQASKARSAKASATRLDIPMDNLTGAKYYPYSDYGVYRTKDWYASVRMQSDRIIGYEHTNQENMLGYFSSDGAMLSRRDGDEYEDVSACWNWKHVPGVTSYDNGKPLWGTPDEKTPYNKSSRVFGKVVGDVLVTAMEYNRAGVHAHKAWFFTPEGIICLGAGITLDPGLGYDVVTAIDQRRLEGKVTTSEKWVSHEGTTYVLLDGNTYKIAPYKHTGSWYPIHPAQSKDEVSMDLLDIWIDHGKDPKNASYAYAVLPNGKTGAKSAKIAARSIKVLSNENGLQKVMVGGKVLTVDWNAAGNEISISQK